MLKIFDQSYKNFVQNEVSKHRIFTLLRTLQDSHAHPRIKNSFKGFIFI